MREDKDIYIVIKEFYLTDLTKKVNEKISEGYLPSGDLIFTSGVNEFLQPMILTEKHYY